MNTVTTASQVDGFIAKYSPKIAKAFKACRRKMRALMPGGYELVYDNYNALGIGYGPGDRASDVVLSIVAYPKWIRLFFLHGAELNDPTSLLDGTGRRVRGIRLESASDLDRPDVKRLISQALSTHSKAMARHPRIRTIVKMVLAKQRSRRPPRRGAG